MPELAHSAIVRCHKSEFRFHPICSRSDIHEQRNGECRGVFHLALHERCYGVYLSNRYFENELIVYLQKHAPAQPFSTEPVANTDPCDLDQIGGRALNW